MSSPSKRKGTAWETTLRDFLIEHSFDTVRNTTNGAFDIGDLAVRVNGRHYVVEAKATKQIDLAGFISEAYVEADNYAALNKLSPADVFPVVIVKRRNHGTAKAYVVMELGEWLRDRI